MCCDDGLLQIQSSRNNNGPTTSNPAMRRRPSRISQTGRREKFLSRASFKASPTGVCFSTVTIFASGVAIWPTVKFCRSSTRLIIARSSLVSACADSCMTARISSRLPNSRPVKACPPVQRKIVLRNVLDNQDQRTQARN